MSFARLTAAVALVALTLFVHDAGAQTLSKCSAGKKKCVAKKVNGLLKCHQKAEKKGLAVDLVCLQKVRDKFEGNPDPTKGCFAKLEAKNQNCLTFLDMPLVENMVDTFVDEIVCQLDPAAGTCPVPTASPTCPSFATPTPGPTSTPSCMPMPEVCNGADDDCNGMIDDGLFPITCGTGQCQNTVPSCVGGMQQTCTPNPPSAESCNGMDDDCDGMVDEGLGTVTCGIGACMNTMPSCVGGMPQMCTPNPPSAEVCNNIDDNCNGTVDEGTITCGTGACMNTVPKCVGGMDNTCMPGTPTTEVCGNAIDDDCDGSVDEMPCI